MKTRNVRGRSKSSKFADQVGPRNTLEGKNLCVEVLLETDLRIGTCGHKRGQWDWTEGALTSSFKDIWNWNKESWCLCPPKGVPSHWKQVGLRGRAPLGWDNSQGRRKDSTSVVSAVWRISSSILKGDLMAHPIIHFDSLFQKEWRFLRTQVCHLEKPKFRNWGEGNPGEREIVRRY